MEHVSVWQRCKKGDKNAFRELYLENIDSLMAYGRKICSDADILQDAVHDLFVYIWEKRETLSDTDSAIKYLCVSLRRRLIKDMEKDHQVSQSEVLENHIYYSETSPETQWMEKEEQTKSQQLLQEAMLKLPKRQQEALHLKYYENLPYEDICTIMEINYQSVRNLISRAVSDLRNFL
jgi:RNA polymerase sigma factor (sigma-70 family)